MRESIEEPREMITCVVVPDTAIGFVDLEDEPSAVEECCWCGHSPCGCGG
jgi:hypothetical protein